MIAIAITDDLNPNTKEREKLNNYKDLGIAANRMR